MFEAAGILRDARFFLGGVLLAAAVSLQAQQQPAPVSESAPVSEGAKLLPTYPPGSIATVAGADAALEAARLAHLVEERRYEQARRVCYREFFAESCLGKARLAHVEAVERIRALEQEARVFKRRDAARIIDERLAARKRAEEEGAAERAARGVRERAARAQRIEESERRVRESDADAAGRALRANESAQREERRAEERARRDAEDAARAPERAERARQHEARITEARERALRREREAAEKTRKPGAGNGAAGQGG